MNVNVNEVTIYGARAFRKDSGSRLLQTIEAFLSHTIVVRPGRSPHLVLHDVVSYSLAAVPAPAFDCTEQLVLREDSDWLVSVLHG